MSLGTSPTAPSLLIPPNPAFGSVESAPRGGILINVHRASEPFLTGIPSPVEATSPVKSYFSAHFRRPSEPGSPVTPSTATLDESASTVPLASPSLGTDGKSLKIRFAPLPDPRRPRSLSTGRNIAWTATVGADGEEKRNLEMKDHTLDGSAVDDEDEEEGDDDPDFEGDEGEEDESGGNKRGRSWSKTVGSSWKGTKKLLTGKNPLKEKEKEADKLDPVDSNAYGSGAPLKKSVSTGGFVGSSPFRWSNETERRRSMQGPPPATISSLITSRSENSSLFSASSPSHRRNSSLEGGGLSASLGSSPAPVRMLNGRVYGSRRASEAAEREKQLRERNEPAFVEWGSNAMGSNASTAPQKTGGFLGDDDDGGGMSWVKRRREERQRKEQEEREKQLRESGADGAKEGVGVSFGPGAGVGLSSSRSSASSLETSDRPTLSVDTIDPKTPAISESELPPTPMIQVSSPVTSTEGAMQEPAPFSPHSTVGMSALSKPTLAPGTVPPAAGERGKVGMGKGPEHVVTAMRIPSDGEAKRHAARHRDVFDDEVSPTRKVMSDEEEEDEEEEEEGEEEDDGDFDDDDEEEVDIRTTSSAAGVEVVSRHK